MQSIQMDQKIIQRQQWKQIWPVRLLAIIATGQMLLTFTIIGLETWSMLLNLKFAFLFVGYKAAFFFTLTWISTFTVVCCNRESQGCARHVLIENCLSIIASSILLYYDAQFLRKPYLCLWSNRICSDIDWNYMSISWWQNYDNDIQNAKITAIKLQLSCTAIMLALCLSYIMIYICTCSKVKARLAVISPEGTIEVVTQQ